MSARRGCEDDEKFDQTALTASRSCRGRASKDYMRVSKGHRTKLQTERTDNDCKSKQADLLQLQIRSFVRHALVANT